MEKWSPATKLSFLRTVAGSDVPISADASNLESFSEAQLKEMEVTLNQQKLQLEQSLNRIKAERARRDPHKIAKYTMFPPADNEMWTAYCTQEAGFWSAKELDFVSDRECYLRHPKMTDRYRQVYIDIFKFFWPGDGMISANVLRYINEAETYEEQTFFIAQLFIEAVHAESYGMSIMAIVSDPVQQAEAFLGVDEIPAIKAKADFIEKYIYSNESKGLRFVAGAAAEGIFFASLFALIHFFSKKELMINFSFMNEQIAKDETLHAENNCRLAKRYLKSEEHERVIEILEEAVQVEIENVKYMLRTPVDSVEADQAMGLTVENMSIYIKMLADRLLAQMGLPIHFRCVTRLLWYEGVSLGVKSNFYERKIGSYKKFSLEQALDWRSRAGLTQKVTSTVSRPEEVDF
jgi:ribonucleoside-diphosphate reductase subunit M2